MTDQTPAQPIEVQQALRRVNDVIGGALRQIAAITGQPDPAPHDEDREAADATVQQAYAVRIRAQQAEARVAELDGVLHRIADIANLRPGRVTVEDGLDDVRTVLERAGYGTQPGGWVPPYSADTALGKIWHVVSNPTVPERPEVTVNSVRDILADMGYHEHVHTRLATADDAPVEACGTTYDGYVGKYACTEPAGHDGDHRDGQYGTTWAAEAVTDDDPLPGCTSTHALGIAVYTCTRPDGHEGYHQDKRYGVAWAADGSPAWRVK
ncbi:hypothetical protein J1763_gp61 [Gordonia phage YorkOnyx]|uniref:Uncharacterized protein n=1 Tax=Gordonia phage YorkOnyx TaxID=2762402 RepID=A0A7G8LMB0_9CAUD|nr:hypothetical protein J1763_gp61 [Gordonia phage YorkOnyx]QNJ58382.1 hypothetical protein SEA_YORKONYX_61 [Gordonia phage YorkOnyx]